MILTGKHLIIDMYGCSSQRLQDSACIRDVLHNAAANSNIAICTYKDYITESGGIAASALSETSHLSLHTYPKSGYAALDIFIYHDQATPERTIALIKKFLRPEKTKVTSVRRGDFGTLRDMKPKIKITIAPFRRVKNTGAKVLHLFSRVK